MRPITGTRPALLLATACAWLVLLYGLRFGLMEVEPAADPCLDSPAGLPCRLRSALGLAIHFEVFGMVALATTGLAWLAPVPWRRGFAAAGLLLGLVALVLYNVRFGAPAVVLALLVLADAGTFRPGGRPSS